MPATIDDVHALLVGLNGKLDRLLDQRGGAHSAPATSSGGGPVNLPNYGKAKGAPIATASDDDLRYYASGCRKSLDNPEKARWHDNERRMLAAIEAEIARRSGGGSAPGADDDIPF